MERRNFLKAATAASSLLAMPKALGVLAWKEENAVFDGETFYTGKVSEITDSVNVTFRNCTFIDPNGLCVDGKNCTVTHCSIVMDTRAGIKFPGVGVAEFKLA